MSQTPGTFVRGLKIKGELVAHEDLTIDGHFEGTIDITGYCLTTGKTSVVNAEVSAGIVSVNGRLDGHITADFVEVRPGALVTANLLTKQFSLEDGAQFNGAVNTERARAAASIARHRRTDNRADVLVDS
ncbi:MAG TPA: polymer-forming cytoskeletal protein [Vicinamibacterales bacterium]|jgi:cytoskeletal protein CcmA (bactofilin family)|nr:polymer-forming cytoskeletal protein [Vicinamibacterales bacterium]